MVGFETYRSKSSTYSETIQVVTSKLFSGPIRALTRGSCKSLTQNKIIVLDKCVQPGPGNLLSTSAVVRSLSMSSVVQHKSSVCVWKGLKKRRK